MPPYRIADSGEVFPRGPQGAPERCLLVALLLDAWNCVASGGRARRPCEEALRWVNGQSPGAMVKFDFVCSHLGLDQEKIRFKFNLVNKIKTPRTTQARGEIIDSRRTRRIF